jgi:ABC-2 type transport system permease protein
MRDGRVLGSLLEHDLFGKPLSGNVLMPLAHILRALRAVTVRELLKFVQQRGRLLSALVRPLIWLAVFAAGFHSVFGASITPPYKTYVTYKIYVVPGCLA